MSLDGFELVDPRVSGRLASAARKVVVIGGGVGGLAAAIDLSRHGCAVTLVDKAERPGGKMREVAVGDNRDEAAKVDAGPTVLTMRWVFDALFDDAGASLEAALDLHRLDVLARHAWADDPSGAVFDLYADEARSAEAIGALAGLSEARRFREFCDRARRIYRHLEEPFIAAQRAGPIDLIRRLGARRVLELTRIAPLTPLWRALGRHFHDPRLRQLFARYATYCGSSPFSAPAVLMLIAHVEQAGVWRVGGGMARLAEALATLARVQGATIRCAASVAEIVTAGGRAAGVRLSSGEVLTADAVICAADVSALAIGDFGLDAARAVRTTPPRRRSLSAVVWSAVAETEGFPLAHHSVFFPPDYAAEFRDVFARRRTPRDPTVYICAQDRGDAGAATGPERLHILVNAPPDGDDPAAAASGGPLCEAEIDACEMRMTALLARCGLTLRKNPAQWRRTTPVDFAQLFPATGGALYGPANHGPLGTFARQGGPTAIPGLYLAGGSVHPGPGVPMATLSGRLAAALAMRDFASNPRLRPAAISGGISTA